MNYNKYRKNQKKIILTPALRMESETQAIQRKLEELKKSISKSGKIRKKKFEASSEKNFSRFLEKKKSDSKRSRKRLLERGKKGSAKGLILRGRKDANLTSRLSNRGKKDGEAGYSFKESKMNLRRKIMKLRSNGQEASEGGNNTLSTASSRSGVYQRYVALDDSIEEHDYTPSGGRIKRFNTYNGEDEDEGSDAGIVSKSQEAGLRFESLDESRDVGGNGECEVAMLDFLVTNGLGKYSDAFVDNGFADMETLREIEETHLETMRIPKGFRIKLLKALKKYEGKKNEKKAKEFDFEENETLKQKKFNNFLQHEEDPIPQNQEATHYSQEIKDEVHDMEEVKRKFNSISKKTVKFAALKPTKTTSTSSTSTGTGSQSTETAKRSACYNCYSIMRGEEHKSEFSGERIFCSKKCMKLFLLHNSAICKNEDCRKVLNKLDCVYKGESLFCSNKCGEGVDGRKVVYERMGEETGDISEGNMDFGLGLGLEDDQDFDLGDVDMNFDDI